MILNVLEGMDIIIAITTNIMIPAKKNGVGRKDEGSLRNDGQVEKWNVGRMEKQTCKNISKIKDERLKQWVNI